MKLFSAFGAATLLERDRQTVARALRHVTPDGREGKSLRWRLPTIIKALEVSNRTNNVSLGGRTGVDRELTVLFGEFDDAYEEMMALSTVSERRAAARKIGPLIRQTDQMLREHGAAMGIDDELTQLRCDKILSLCLLGFETACGWDRAETYKMILR